MKIEFTPESIEQAIVQSIVQSAIGQQITIAVNKVVGSYTLQSAIEEEIGKVVRSMVRDMAMADETLRPLVEAEVRKHMTEKTVSEIVGKLMERAMRDY
jgi:hypothetical protein